MNNEEKPNESLSDEQLDAMLRDVTFPSDLKLKLKLIPELTGTPEPNLPGAGMDSAVSQSQLPTASRTSMLSYVLTACVFGIAAFTAAQWWSGTESQVSIARPDDGSDNDSPSGGVLVDGNDSTAASQTEPASQSLESLLAEIEESDKRLMAIEQEMKLARLTASLNVQKRLGAVRLDSRETDSLVMALSKQVALPITGSDEDVRLEMVRVLDKFPGTRGAKLAKDYLETLN